MVWTYFVQTGESGPVKIGRTENPTNRIASLQTGTPEVLHLLGVIEGDFENRIHQAFDHLRIRGEWFEPTVELRSFIDTYTAPFNPQDGIRRAAQLVVDVHEDMQHEVTEMWHELAVHLLGKREWPHLHAFNEAVTMLAIRLQASKFAMSCRPIEESPQLRMLNSTATPSTQTKAAK